MSRSKDAAGLLRAAHGPDACAILIELVGTEEHARRHQPGDMNRDRQS